MQGEGARILLVDDDPDLQIAMGAVLQSRNYTVISARDGEEALSKLRTESPDLMILDLMMPRMDGFSVLKELKDPRWDDCRGVPVIVLTSVKEDAGRRRYELETALSMDVDDYVEKPIDPFVLLSRIQPFLRQTG
ncbi:MAG: response regulator transcription factor [Chloroflexota bacterium]|nr:MAG: response regulator transcription factor [Chloroflexota bacterium]